MAKSLQQCPVCHRQVEKLFLLDLEEHRFLVCEECLRNPQTVRELHDMAEEHGDDSQFEEELWLDEED